MPQQSHESLEPFDIVYSSHIPQERDYDDIEDWNLIKLVHHRQRKLLLDERWSEHYLRNNLMRSGITFEPQVAFINWSNRRFYIVDFYLPALKRIVEVDGSSHFGREAYDKRRDQQFQDRGYEIARVTASELWEQAVLEGNTRVQAEQEEHL
ncbi:MAG: endonuclease [Siphoviridae sp. ctvD11]|nr:MAG: endonuclease [Siphoviridae sp. ctvD11]